MILQVILTWKGIQYHDDYFYYNNIIIIAYHC